MFGDISIYYNKECKRYIIESKDLEADKFLKTKGYAGSIDVVRNKKLIAKYIRKVIRGKHFWVEFEHRGLTPEFLEIFDKELKVAQRGKGLDVIANCSKIDEKMLNKYEEYLEKMGKVALTRTLITYLVSADFKDKESVARIEKLLIKYNENVYASVFEQTLSRKTQGIWSKEFLTVCESRLRINTMIGKGVYTKEQLLELDIATILNNIDTILSVPELSIGDLIRKVGKGRLENKINVDLTTKGLSQKRFEEIQEYRLDIDDRLWRVISKTQGLTEAFVRKNKDFVYWKYVLQHNSYNEKFLREHKEYVLVGKAY